MCICFVFILTFHACYCASFPPFLPLLDQFCFMLFFHTLNSVSIVMTILKYGQGLFLEPKDSCPCRFWEPCRLAAETSGTWALVLVQGCVCLSASWAQRVVKRSLSTSLHKRQRLSSVPATECSSGFFTFPCNG